MTGISGSKRFVFTIALLLCLMRPVSGTGWSPPDEPSEMAVKTVYLLHFVEFITWPDDSTIHDKDKPFVIGFIGDKTMAGEMSTIASGRTIPKYTNKINVRFIEDLDEIFTCNLLFISETGKIDVTKVLDMIKERPILTVSDAQGMIQKGCHIRMYMRREKIRFEINEDSLKDSMLQASYHLLRAADKTFKQKKKGRLRR